jgi:hypothetical protein
MPGDRSYDTPASSPLQRAHRHGGFSHRRRGVGWLKPISVSPVNGAENYLEGPIFQA